MSATPRGDLWLGDALRAVTGLAADAEAAAEIVRLLGLAADRPAMRGAFDEAPPAHAADRDDAPAPVPRDAAPAPADPEPARALDARGGDHRLPSRLEASTVGDARAPAWLPGTEPLRIEAPPELAAPPLLSRQRRRALLTTLLATEVEDGAPDIRRIVECLASGRPLDQLPRLTRRTLRHGVELRIDRAPWLQPFFGDQTELAGYLRALCPPERVRVLTIDGGPQPIAPRPRRGRPLSAAPDTHHWTGLSRAPLLLLSDLGAGYRPQAQVPAGRATWQTLAEAMCRQGRAAIALSPFRPPPGQAIAGLALLHWSERCTVGDAVRARLGQAQATRHGAVDDRAVEGLAELLSPALRITPWLLRQARTRFMPQLEPAAEADLWFSELVQSAGPAGVILDPESAAALRASLAASERLEPALRLLAESRAGASDGSAVEEALIALELRRRLDETTAETALRPALKALSASGAPAEAIATWAAHAWRRFSCAVRNTRAARQLAFAAGRHLDTRSWLLQSTGAKSAQAALPALPAGSGWLYGGAELPGVTLSVELRRYADGSTNLVLGPAQPATVALHRIELPLTTPLWLEVAGGVEGSAQTVPVDPQATTQIDVGESTPDQPLTLRTLRGDGWRLARAPTMRDGLRGALLLAEDPGAVAVLLDERLAVMPLRGVANVAASAIEVGRVLRLRLPDTNEWIEARVLGEVDDASLDALALDLMQAAPGRVPLDGQMRLPHADKADRADVFIGFGPDGVHEDALLPYLGEGSYDWIDGSGRLIPPGLLAPGFTGEWMLVFAGQVGPTPSSGKQRGPAVNPLPIPVARVHEYLRDLQSKPPTAFLLATPQAGDLAFRIWDELVLRLGSGRVRHDHDGRILDDPATLRRVIDESTAIVLVGAGAPDETLTVAVRQAYAAGRPVLWAPIGADARVARNDWPTLLREPLSAATILDESDPERLTERIADWLDGLPPPRLLERSTAAPAALRPAAPTSLGSSLRARFASLIERREGKDLGLFPIDLSLGPVDVSPAAKTHPLAGKALGQAVRNGPMLLFIPGELSDSAGSFGGLLSEPNAEIERLHERYGEAVFRFEYRSVTRGPLSNAVELLRALPLRARLHIVSFSAGGLLGELLCLGQIVGGRDSDALEPEALPILPADSAEPGHAELMQKLMHLLAVRAPAIERFVRVACPAAGTPLYGRGIEFSVGLLGMIPLAGTALRLMPGIDRLLGDPQASPGLTTLAPGAGVLPLLDTRRTTYAPLTVVAGIARPDGLISRVTRAAARLATGTRDGEDDLVVSLASAFGGLERSGGVDYLIDEGSDISHFNFFRNDPTRRAIVDALLGDKRPPAGFRHASTLAELQARFAAPSV